MTRVRYWRSSNIHALYAFHYCCYQTIDTPIIVSSVSYFIRQLMFQDNNVYIICYPEFIVSLGFSTTPHNVHATVSVSHDPVHGIFSTIFKLPILWMKVFAKIRRLSHILCIYMCV